VRGSGLILGGVLALREPLKRNSGRGDEQSVLGKGAQKKGGRRDLSRSLGPRAAEIETKGGN